MPTSPADSRICQLWAEIHTVAPARFTGFATPADKTPLDSLARYIWNLELCCSLYRPLHFLEIGLRNSIHNAMSASTGRFDWFDNPSLLRVVEQKKIKRARAEIRARRVTATPDRIVAALHFGFWTTLFSTHYEVRVFRPHAADIFPNLPRKDRNRRVVSPRIEDARKLRNRVFHHEPVWHFSNLRERHQRLLETIAWISTPLAQATWLVDDFEHHHSAGWQSIRAEIDTAIRRHDDVTNGASK